MDQFGTCSLRKGSHQHDKRWIARCACMGKVGKSTAVAFHHWRDRNTPLQIAAQLPDASASQMTSRERGSLSRPTAPATTLRETLRLRQLARTRKSCLPCRERKVRCDKELPCSTCTKRMHPGPVRLRRRHTRKAWLPSATARPGGCCPLRQPQCWQC